MGLTFPPFCMWRKLLILLLHAVTIICCIFCVLLIGPGVCFLLAADSLNDWADRLTARLKMPSKSPSASNS